MLRRLLRPQKRQYARGDEQEHAALDDVEPAMRDVRRLPRERHDRLGLRQERREPFEPQQNPAVEPLESLFRNDRGVETHERECAPDGKAVGLIFAAALAGAGICGRGCGIEAVLSRP